MLIARFVVAHRAAHQPGRELVGIQRAGRLPRHHLLDEVQQRPPVAIGHLDQRRPRRTVEGQRAAQILLGTLRQQLQIGRAKALEHQHLRPAEQRGVQLERRIHRGNTAQQDGAVFHMRQEPVLLSLVETVDLVDEQQRPLPVRAPVLGRLEHLAQLRHAGEDRADLDEMQIGLARQQAGDRGLAHAGRPPEHQRAKAARGKHRAKRPVRAQHLVLPDHLGQRLRPQPVGQGARRGVGRGAGGGIEQVGHGPNLGARAPRRQQITACFFLAKILCGGPGVQNPRPRPPQSRLYSCARWIASAVVRTNSLSRAERSRALNALSEIPSSAAASA